MEFVQKNIEIIDENTIECLLPIFTASEANGGVKKTYVVNGKVRYKSETWQDRYKRHRTQKNMVYMVLKQYKKNLRLPCLITLTRYAPRKLDRHDNLPMSMKYVLDACCAVITGDYRPGRADDTDLIDVIYKQESSNEYGVKILIQNSFISKLGI